MIAIVMSGAANFGAMQAGALEIVMQSGVKPRMLVGSSAGALNAIYLAADPSVERVRELQGMWRAAGPAEVGVPKPFVALRRIVQQKDGLIDSTRLARFLEERLPADITTFAELEMMKNIKTYVTAVDVDGGAMHVFGDDPADHLIDAAMASSAVPPYFPPWKVGEKRYLDGGVYAKLPLCVAIERGATQILALDVTFPMGSASNAHGIMGVSGYSLSLMIQAQTAYEVAWAQMTGIPTRVIELEAPSEVPFWDYTKADYLIDCGRKMAAADIEAEPIKIAPTFSRILRRLRRPRRPHPLVNVAHKTTDHNSKESTKNLNDSKGG
jgi:NTE family protein